MDVTPTAITAITGGIALVTTGALIQVVRLFLRHIASSDARQEKFLSNHMSANVAVQQATVLAQERVADRLERVERAVTRAPSVKVTSADEVEVTP